jgi:hypothetical protein
LAKISFGKPLIFARTIIFGLCLLLAVLPALSDAALVINEIDVANENQAYTISFDVLVEGDAAKARAIVSDYRQWTTLSKALTEARLIAQYPDGRQRVSVTLRACVLVIFCKSVRQVKDLGPFVPPDTYRTVMVAGEGDFKSGYETWQVGADAQNKTRLKYHAVLVLGLRVPPVIGPWVLRRHLQAELVRTAEKVEMLLTR